MTKRLQPMKVTVGQTFWLILPFSGLSKDECPWAVTKVNRETSTVTLERR